MSSSLPVDGESQPEPEMPLYSVGHSNHPPQRLFEIIAPFQITLLIDIRSVPYSGRFPHFNRDNLKKLCDERGIVYEWRGDTLGGLKGRRPSDSSFELIADSVSFRKAIEKLADLSSDANPVEAGKHKTDSRVLFIDVESDNPAPLTSRETTACLICAEWDPRKCHRSMLIGPILRSLPDGGIDLHHILPDGTLILQSELEEERDVPKVDRAGTRPLFDDPVDI